MARQVLPTIDFRTQAQRQGVTRTQQTTQAIASILQTVGTAEQKRRQSQTLDRITRAISGGATTVEAIVAAAEQGPEFATGFRGGLQRFAGGFQPGGGIKQGIQQTVIGQILQQALMPPPKPITVPAGAGLVTPTGEELYNQPKPMLPTQKAAQAKLDAYNKAKAVSPLERTKHQQAVVEKYELGQALVQINLGRASPTERTDIAETRASVDALNNIKELYDNAKTRTGPVVGRLDPILGTFGWTTQEQEDFMAATSAFRNRIIKEITGAQMSEVEAKRILKQVPQETDPSARWEAKWRQSKKNLEFLQKRRLEILRQSGLQAPSGVSGEKNVSEMTIEELNKLAGIE